ncbi:MAG: hypothetical protein OEL83_13440 [Desulforhopalus sp.]|nr:hypothetical protein [Desulforhopalus sp.]
MLIKHNNPWPDLCFTTCKPVLVETGLLTVANGQDIGTVSLTPVKVQRSGAAPKIKEKFNQEQRKK